MKRIIFLPLLTALCLSAAARLDAQLFSVPKQLPAASARLEDAFRRLGPEQRLPVLVYFTDKQVFSDGQFRAALALRRSQLSARALQRRAKCGSGGITFLDLPVSSSYIDQVRALGATLRQRLNWFNAASFEMTAAQAQAAAQLGCVQRLDLVARWRAAPAPQQRPEPETPSATPAKAHLLNYGPSYWQLHQINVDVCHDSGYSGSGVLVAMFDNGFRKGHHAFDSIRATGRLVDQWDFVSGQPLVDSASHGTGTWSEAGGYVPGKLIGPAYKAIWAIYHTEDNNQEMPVEEDHWAAALQRADSVGADVVSSSLGYFDFDSTQYSYTYADMDGNTAISTIAARHAAALGIVVCNAMGNSGPAIGTIIAPADADSIISVGAVDSLGVIADFSSRGPTYDGRRKPEVCAKGVSDYWASWTGISSYSSGGTGTSCSTPLVAGSCALVIQAHPAWTPLQVRQALMMTASKHANPDSSTYGGGIIDVWAAIHYDTSAAGVGGLSRPAAGRFFVVRAYPNPASGAATISLTLPRAGLVTASLYDAAGRCMRTLPAVAMTAGSNRLCWDGRDQTGRPAAAGVYFCRISAPGGSAVARIVMVR
ncbi:MAG TPA: S8 family serine peptidase [Candidatus Edwardsbacteria bacterium]|nr:S8 family serine peptidase [Candidatus Edwardsbacteria bacterium]